MIVHRSQVVMTAHIAAWIDDQPARIEWLLICLARHNRHDWGDLDPTDKRANDHAAAAQDGRILSRYELPTALVDEMADDSAIWIITDDLDDPDAATTILWPSDY